jgi:hypothetical protein
MNKYLTHPGSMAPVWLIPASLLVVLIFLSLGITWLSRQTHWELSRMRSVSLGEARRGSLGSWIQLSISLTLVLSTILAGSYVCVHLGDWLAMPAGSVLGAFVPLASIVGLILMFHLLLLVPLLGPIGPVEEYNFIENIMMWIRLCRKQAGRIFIYQGFALVLGLVAAIPSLLPYCLTIRYGAYFIGTESGSIHNNVGSIYSLGIEFLFGLAIAPLFVFVIVSNVILYLNLRYEFSANR